MRDPSSIHEVCGVPRVPQVPKRLSSRCFSFGTVRNKVCHVAYGVRKLTLPIPQEKYLISCTCTNTQCGIAMLLNLSRDRYKEKWQPSAASIAAISWGSEELKTRKRPKSSTDSPLSGKPAGGWGWYTSWCTRLSAKTVG